MTLSPRCECSDPGCPVCRGKCADVATMELERADMSNARVCMCDDCASDALDSGIFSTEPADDDSAVGGVQ